MRTRKAIEESGTKKEILILETLLDIRDLLKKNNTGKPKKVAKNKI